MLAALLHSTPAAHISQTMWRGTTRNGIIELSQRAPPIFDWFYLFSSPILSRRRLDVYDTSTHDVALMRIQNASLKCAARGSLKIPDTKNRQKFAIGAPVHNVGCENIA